VEDSITRWLAQFKDGDEDAARRLWARYFPRLVGLARLKLQGAPRRVADEEDIALSAFNSFFRGVDRGHFPDLTDRDNLWRLLVAITARKAQHLLRDQLRQKRGGGAVVGESGLAQGGEDAGQVFDQIAGEEPTPEFAAEMAEECRRLLELLGDEE